MKSAGMQESIDRMIAEDEAFEKLKTPQFAHQKVGTDALVTFPEFALFDEMGAGKSKQVVDAACALFSGNQIDTVVIICPASVRCVWIDKEIGEIKKHAWVESHVLEFHAKTKLIWGDSPEYGNLRWIVTNYEFLRNAERLKELCAAIGKQTMLVLDES